MTMLHKRPFLSKTIHQFYLVFHIYFFAMLRSLFSLRLGR